MSRNIKLCHPRLQELADRLVRECAKQGLIVKIGESFRSSSEQDKLYAQGRTTSGNIVTNARGSSYSSMHQWGVAFDVIRNDGRGAYYDNDGWFSKVGAIGKRLGLEWGGDWTSPVDKPHFQLPDWGSTPARLKRLYGNVNNFKKTWEVDDMTESEVRKIAQKEANDMVYRYRDKVYNKISEVPEWGRPTIEKLMDIGALIGSDKGLEISETLLRVLVINDRAGVYK